MIPALMCVLWLNADITEDASAKENVGGRETKTKQGIGDPGNHSVSVCVCEFELISGYV